MVSSLSSIPGPHGQSTTKSYWLGSPLSEIQLGSSLTAPVFLQCPPPLANNLMRDPSYCHIWGDIFKAKPKYTLLLPQTVSNWNQITNMTEWALHGRVPPNSPTLSSTFPSSTHMPCLSSKLKYLLSWTCWAASNLCVLAPSDGAPCPLQTFQKILHLASFRSKACRQVRCFSSCVFCLFLTHIAIWAFTVLSGCGSMHVSCLSTILSAL